jgi:arginyl-tRNA synthetase
MPSMKMRNITEILQEGVAKALQSGFGAEVRAEEVAVSPTRREFEGDFTVVVFPFTRLTKQSPEQTAEAIGAYLLAHVPEAARYNVVKGFLNIVVSDRYFLDFLASVAAREDYGFAPPSGEKLLVEYCSPNTNKPLHLGHIRNILLGWSMSRIFEAAGHEVKRVQIINDRGIAICKSMLAWEKYAQGATPKSTGMKSDHFVGYYYVLFERKFQEEYQAWQQSDQARQAFAARAKNGRSPEDFFKEFKNVYFNEYSALGAAAKEMLRRWEAGDEKVLALWQRMNQWVYDGFEDTYRALGVSFDKLYYESETYHLGKDLIEEGLRKGLFFQEEDGSVWVDLAEAKLDRKLLLRSDGTSVYITQDLGTAHQRYLDFGVDRMVYVVADEQNYHFQVLFEVLKRLGKPYAQGLFHLSYGMVNLPSGKMKSREGTVVDADDLIAEVIEEARAGAQDRGIIAELPAAEQESIIRAIGLAALKFFIIRVQPRKGMVFDPKESVDLQGQTGPYIQNAYVRVRSVLRKSENAPTGDYEAYGPLQALEREILLMLYDFPQQIQAAAREYDPSAIANYCYNLAKTYHRFYHDVPILTARTEAAKAFRLTLSAAAARTLKTGMDLLGIAMPERM